MTAEAQKLMAVIVDTTIPAPKPVESPVEPTKQPEPPQMDAFGRTADERTVELEEQDAEWINVETDAGRHQSYSDALHYVLTRGFAEIKRTREAAKALVEKTLLKAKRDNWDKLLQSNPALIQNQELLATMLKELGIGQPKTTTK